MIFVGKTLTQFDERPVVIDEETAQLYECWVETDRELLAEEVVWEAMTRTEVCEACEMLFGFYDFDPYVLKEYILHLPTIEEFCEFCMVDLWYVIDGQEYFLIAGVEPMSADRLQPLPCFADMI